MQTPSCWNQVFTATACPLSLYKCGFVLFLVSKWFCTLFCGLVGTTSSVNGQTGCQLVTTLKHSLQCFEIRMPRGGIKSTPKHRVVNADQPFIWLSRWSWLKWLVFSYLWLIFEGFSSYCWSPWICRLIFWSACFKILMKFRSILRKLHTLTSCVV